jgi:hypothetical protein
MGADEEEKEPLVHYPRKEGSIKMMVPPAFEKMYHFY